MKTPRERAEEKRAERLEDIDRQVRNGDLTIRQMTDEERKEFEERDRQPRPPRRQPRR